MPVTRPVTRLTHHTSPFVPHTSPHHVWSHCKRMCAFLLPLPALLTQPPQDSAWKAKEQTDEASWARQKVRPTSFGRRVVRDPTDCRTTGLPDCRTDGLTDPPCCRKKNSSPSSERAWILGPGHSSLPPPPQRDGTILRVATVDKRT